MNALKTEVDVQTKNKNRIVYELKIQAVRALDILGVLIPFGLCWYLYYANRILVPFYRRGNWVILALFVFLYFFLARTYDGMQLSIHRISEMIYSQILAVLVTDGAMYIVICILCKKMANLWPGLACIGGQAIMITLWSILAHQWYFREFKAQTSAVIYETREGMENLIAEYGLSKKFEVKAIYSVMECLDNLSLLDEYQTAFLSGVHSHDRNTILKYCVERDINLYIIPRVGDVIMSGAKRVHLFHLPMLRAGRYNPSIFYLFAKRLFDILVSGIALIITSPISLVISIAVKSDGGPVFYKQERLTKNGKVFKVIKFRSMRTDAEKDGVARLSTGDNDDRITKVGRFIRKARIDELPQLINIFRGEMTLVGPRPERPSIAADYEEEFPEFHLRLQAKAGLTGYAQVYGKYNTTPYDKLMMDLMYMANPSIIEDLKIMMATVKILFLPESTEGVAAGQTTAMDYENAADSTEKDTDTVKNRAD